MKLNKIISSITVIFFLFLLIRGTRAQSQYPVEVYFFYSEACSHCHEMNSFLGTLVQKNSNIKIISYEVSGNKDNQALWYEMASAYGKSAGAVPMLFIGDQVIEGNYPEEVEGAIDNCAINGCESPLKKLEEKDNKNNETKEKDSFFMELRWVIIIIAILFLGIIFVLSRKKGE